MRIFPAMFFAVAMGSMPALAQPAPDVSDLVGARAAGGETQMLARGYRLIRSNTVRDQVWSFWYSDVQKQCVSIAVSNGRYDAINRVPDQNCRPGDGNYTQGQAAFADPAPQDSTGYISLLCYGSGEKPGVQARSGYAYDPRTGRYEYRSRVESTTDGFDADLLVEMRDGAGRIHLSGKLIAPINSGGRDGWWDLQDLRVTPDTISARYRMNGLNSPRVQIDRCSGRIDIDGIEHFSGHCDRGTGRRF